MKANEKILGFLIGSYTQMVKTFGKEQKTNDFFLLQMRNLKKIGQVSEKDAEIVTNVIGLGSNPFEWEKSQIRIKTFVEIMDSLYELDDKSKEIKLDTMHELGGISNEMYSIVKSAYDLPDIKMEQKKRYSTLFHNFDEDTNPSNITSTKVMNSKVTNASENTSWENFKQKCNSNCVFHVRNPYAVCSSDPLYYDVKVKDLEQNERILKLLKDGTKFEICVKEKHDDGCHISYSYKTKEHLTELAKKIDFKKIYESCLEKNDEREL